MKKKAKKSKLNKKQRKALAVAAKAMGALTAMVAAGLALMASRGQLLGAAKTASAPWLDKWREYRRTPAIDERGLNGAGRTSSVEPETMSTRFGRVHP